jgi:ATP adenylyltransferase
VHSCKYCAWREHGLVPEGMHAVARVGGSDAFVLIDRNYPGRCVLASPWHTRELFELAHAQRGEFLEAVNALAAAVSRVCAADKVNIAFYGDESDHLHAHVVPKWRGGLAWGQAFNLQPAPVEAPSSGLFAGATWADVAARLRRFLPKAH